MTEFEHFSENGLDLRILSKSGQFLDPRIGNIGGLCTPRSAKTPKQANTKRDRSVGFSPQNQAAGRVQKGSWEGEIGSRGSKSGFWRSDLGSQTPDLARGGPAEAPGGLERALGGAQGGSGRWTGWEGPRWAYRQPTDAALRDPVPGPLPGYTCCRMPRW